MLLRIGYAMLMSSGLKQLYMVAALPSCAHAYGDGHTTGLVLVDVHFAFVL